MGVANSMSSLTSDKGVTILPNPGIGPFGFYKNKLGKLVDWIKKLLGSKEPMPDMARVSLSKNQAKRARKKKK